MVQYENQVVNEKINLLIKAKIYTNKEINQRLERIKRFKIQLDNNIARHKKEDVISILESERCEVEKLEFRLNIIDSWINEIKG